MRTFFPMAGDYEGPLDRVGRRLAELLTSREGGLTDPTGSSLRFVERLEVRPLPATSTRPPAIWAVDGGQALVLDGRCIQVYVTRAAVTCWSDDRLTVEEQLPLQPFLLGGGEDQLTRAALGAPVAPDCTLDVNLLRDWTEWSAAAKCVEQADPGSLVLVDGDLMPDWRIDPLWLAGVLDRAADRNVTMLGVTKHTGLSWGGAPLLGVLERLAASLAGDRSTWWAPVARSDSEVGPGVQVVVARLDPDARFAFRIDLPGDAEVAPTLAALASVCDDAAFPGYPYPLSAADRLAACPSWLRDDVRMDLEARLDAAGVEPEVRERAFADRHRLMERY